MSKISVKRFIMRTLCTTYAEEYQCGINLSTNTIVLQFLLRWTCICAFLRNIKYKTTFIFYSKWNVDWDCIRHWMISADRRWIRFLVFKAIAATGRKKTLLHSKIRRSSINKFTSTKIPLHIDSDRMKVFFAAKRQLNKNMLNKPVINSKKAG